MNGSAVRRLSAGGRVLTLLLFALGIPFLAHAQDRTGTVVGQVTSLETEAALSSAIVHLLSAPGEDPEISGITGYDGRFRLSGIQPGEYILEISTLGYEARTTPTIRVDANTIYDLGEIPLSTRPIELEAITVVSERPVVSYEADRTGYAMDGMPGAQGGTIQDALGLVPELDLDLDGNVELRGERPAIWIDGRPAPVSGQSLTQFLEQFPAELIDRIEVLDNPSAEYDAEGTGGIINIVLKEDVELGVSGSVFANADTRGNTGVGGRITAQRGDLVVNASSSLRHTDAQTDSYRLRQNLAADPTEFLERDSWNTDSSLGGNLDLRTTWTPREEARVWTRFNYSGRDTERDGLVTTIHMDQAQNPTLRYDRSDLYESVNHSLDFRTGMEWRWDPRHHTLDLEFRLNRGLDHRESLQEVVTEAEMTGFDLTPSDLTLEDREDGEGEIRFDLRYRRPLGEDNSLRAGYGLRDQSTDNDQTISFFDDPDDPLSEVALPLGFLWSQRTHSGYLTFQRQLLSGLSLQGGLRGEHVGWELEAPDGPHVSGAYRDLFPSLNLAWRMDGSRLLRLSYSQRIGRPGVRILDPTNRSTDPLERTVGNPEIEPRYTHRVNVTGSWSGRLGTFSVSPYLSRTTNGWERLTTVDEEGVSTRSWANVSTQTNTGGSVRLSLPRRGDWRGNVSLNGSRSHRDAGNLDERYSGSFTSWRARANLTGPVPGTEGLTAQTRLSYRASGRSVQGRDGSQASVDLSFRYRFMENRASLSLGLRDPFALHESESEIRDLTVWEIQRTSQRRRSAQLSISYALGGAASMGQGRR